MLDLVWRREDGTRRLVSEDIIGDEVMDTVIPLQVQPSHEISLNKDLGNH